MGAIPPIFPPPRRPVTGGVRFVVAVRLPWRGRSAARALPRQRGAARSPRARDEGLVQAARRALLESARQSMARARGWSVEGARNRSCSDSGGGDPGILESWSRLKGRRAPRPSCMAMTPRPAARSPTTGRWDRRSRTSSRRASRPWATAPPSSAASRGGSGGDPGSHGPPAPWNGQGRGFSAPEGGRGLRATLANFSAVMIGGNVIPQRDFSSA